MTFIGFAIKARKIAFGLNQIESCKKRIYLMIICHSASENTAKAAIALAEKRGAAALMTQGVLLEDIVNKPNCKSAAITDEELAAAIRRYAGRHFKNIGREGQDE